MRLEQLSVDHVELLLELRLRNREHFLTGEPVREEGFFSLAGQREVLEALEEDREAGRRELFGVFADRDDALAGYLTLNIVRGAFDNAYLGYAIDRERTGRGLGTQVVAAGVSHAWATGLHRVQANVATTNHASRRVLEKNRFRHEGTGLRHLHIGGEWTDHHLYAKTIEEDRGDGAG